MAIYEEFTIDQGSDVAIQLELVDENDAVKDLSNYSVSAKMKKNYNSDSADTHDFTAIVSTPPTDGIVVLSLTNEQTESLKKGRYVYDVELSYTDNSGNIIIDRILEGRIQVTPSVTR